MVHNYKILTLSKMEKIYCLANWKKNVISTFLFTAGIFLYLNVLVYYTYQSQNSK